MPTNSDPGWDELGLNLSDVTPDNLCSLGQRPYLMTGGLVQAMRQHFAARDLIADPVLKECVWTPEQDSGIVVESITRWLPDVSNRRPAIVVKRNDFSVLSLGINDELQGWYSADGNEYYTTFLRGSHTMFCLANEAGECERLGCEVYREFIQFGGVLRRYLQLLKFKVAECGQLSRLEEAAGGYAVPVSVAYAFEESWIIQPNAPRLKRISLAAIIDNML